jgi:DNA-directed RNA polymerase specialized sigma24 family protein
MACWDYLLSTEGCRFLLRTNDENLSNRGDYRVVTDTDYSRLAHRVFRACVVAFAQDPSTSSLSQYVRLHFWPSLLDAYRTLEDPPDTRQRKLTAYSYLRCIPYRFLNAFHHELVSRTVETLPATERQALTGYFLHFFTLQATAETMTLSLEPAQDALRHSLLTLLIHNRLVYCLLRQIERY